MRATQRSDEIRCAQREVAEAYRRWAPTYDEETTLSALDELAVAALSPGRGGRMLDAGCGTGRRLPHEDFALGCDFSMPMLRAGQRVGRVVNADVAQLPFATASFDLVWCRLVIGHLPAVGRAYAELGRVCRPSGRLVVTDLHPDAARAKMRRTFVDAEGIAGEVPHHRHDIETHAQAARDAGLLTRRVESWVVGPSIRTFFEAAGDLSRYERMIGQRMLLGLSFEKAS